MSDSDDLMPTNVYRYQNESTVVCAKGPNINNTNITGLSFRNNVLSSTMNVPRNFDRQRYPEHSFDQRSLAYSRRETSPMSMYSDMRPRNFQHSYYHGGMSSQRSMYNGRSGSPMSMRSMDSNASVSAADIASAFKNVKFNKYDLRMIKEAYNKFVKRRVRKRIEKRRNMRLFLKGYRRKSGYDSGDLGSDSSISSDDCRSTHSAMYKDNMSSSRSTRTDIMDFRRSIKESNMYKDCTNSLKNSAFRNIYSVPSSSTSVHHRSNNQTSSQSQNPPVFNQKERFQNGFLLPSQRFNKSVASVPIPEIQRTQNKLSSRVCRNNAAVNQKGNVIDEMDSDQEEIFSEITVRENNPDYQLSKVSEKRTMELEENECSDKKRTKLSTPAKNSANVATKKVRNVLKEDNTNKQHESNGKVVQDFEFLKPQFPARKVSSSKFKDQLISKSAAPLTDDILTPLNVPKGVKNQIPVEHPKAPSNSNKNTDITVDEQSEITQHSNSDMSMRPSFIKRKLFSQKMDVTEKKNLSTEAININSPQTNVYSDIQREKHKARKVVTNQSCLNRDIAQDDNNLLDLIHKIVPPDRMNATNVSNKTNAKLSQGSVKHDDDKWDVTSVISMCNNDDVSDTYTDEEIFNDKKNKKRNEEKPKENPVKINDCKVVLEKSTGIKESVNTQNTLSNKPLSPSTSKNVVDNNKKSVYNCVKSFWDTDFESDLETPGPKSRAALIGNQNKTILQQINKDIPQNHSANASGIHNTTSLSANLTKNSLLDTTTSKLKKYNINRNLTIKAFRTPKIKMTEKKVANYEEDTPPPDHKKNNKKTEKENLKTKITEKKKSTEKKINNNAVKEIEKKKEPRPTLTKPKVNKSTVINIQNKNRKLPEHLNKVKDTIMNNKIARNASTMDANVTVTKSLRISKKKVCCTDHTNTEKHVEPAVHPKENKTLNKSKPVKTTATSNNKVANKKNVKTKQTPENNKKIQNMQSPKVDEEEQLSRTLRTRKIDLSSSMNTSNENITNITFRSLRTRKVNLSSSINDSTMEGNLTVVTKTIQRTPAKKVLTGKTIQNDTKKGRIAKKNVKG